MLLICSYNFAQQFPSSGLVRAYDFTNGSLIDLVDSNDLTQNGSAATLVNDRSGNSANAYNVNGDYLNANDVNYGVTGAGNNTNVISTLSFWVKTTANNSQIETIIDESGRINASTTNWYGYYIYLMNGKINVDVRYQLHQFYPATVYTYKSVTAQSSTNLADGLWHHVVVSIDKQERFQFTYDNEYTTKVYIDNVLEDTGYNTDSGNKTISINHDTNSTGFTISNTSSGGLNSTEIYKDDIDDILVYNRLLTLAEIQFLYTDTEMCVSPNNAILSASAVTETTATINIAGTETYDIAYHKTAEPFANAIIETGITTGSINLTLLDDSTSYNVYARKHCPSSISEWSKFISFTTEAPFSRTYVNINATGANDGSSWADAFTNLKQATDAAIAGEEIWIAAGTYTPDASNRTIAYNITQYGIRIYGGFNGTETSISQRNITANPTILSGDLQNNDSGEISFYINTATRVDNSYHVLHITADNIVIDGITITSGFSDANDSSNNRFGAGVLKTGYASNLQFINTTIKDNVAYWGSGIALQSVFGDSNVIIENCVFDNNLSSNVGSGFFIVPAGNTIMNVRIENCLMVNNKTSNNATGTRQGCGASAGMIRAYNSGSVINATIVNNTIANNINVGSGTGDFATFGLSSQNGTYGTVTLANNIFWGNTKNGGTQALAFGRAVGPSFPNSTTVFNSIDDNDFSNFSTKVGTSTSDPLFVNSTDFSLQAGSPGIDSGNNSYVTTSSDLLGYQRIFNSTVDMGAYESSLPLSIEDNNTLENFKLYPNPVNSTLNIQLDGTLNRVEVYSILGRKVLESETSNIKVSHLSSGLYVLKVYSQEGKVGVKRFIKQ